MKAYVDTSVLVSLYTPDVNTASAVEVMQVPAEKVLMPFGELETVNAFGLRVFRKEITVSQAQASLDDFRSDLRDGVLQLRPLPEHCFERALELSRQTAGRLGTRTADILHVAAALEFEVDSFYSFDLQQRKLAKALHLKVAP